MDWTRLGPAIDVRPLFPAERTAMLVLLEDLDADEWDGPTVCPGWTVHDLVGHVLHDHLRRLSGTRDGYRVAALGSSDDVPTALDRANQEFVHVARQLSPRVLVDLLAHVGPQLDAAWADLDLDQTGTLDVWWAAPGVPAPAWLDVARELSELWVHQQQIRDAVGRPGAGHPTLVGPVVDTLLRALPHTLRDVPAPTGTAVRVRVPGPAGGTWTATRDELGWTLAGDPDLDRRTEVEIDVDTLWRLATRGISPTAARAAARVRGDQTLGAMALTVLAIVR